MTENECRQTVRISNIQRFSLDDGPGIRTTVFMKGCSIHCPWCANPESMRYEIQPYYDKKGKIIGRFGRNISLEELLCETLKDKLFYSNDGGVTFSGGEPLLQIKRYEPVLKELKYQGIHIAAETALFVSDDLAEIAKEYFDWFYIDMKILESEKCREILGGNIEQYLTNLKIICGSGKKVCIRIPCSDVTVDDKNIFRVVETLKEIKITEVEVFNLHELAKEKYEKLQMKVPLLDIKYDYAQIMKDYLDKEGVNCRIRRI